MGGDRSRHTLRLPCQSDFPPVVHGCLYRAEIVPSKQAHIAAPHVKYSSFPAMSCGTLAPQTKEFSRI